MSVTPNYSNDWFRPDYFSVLDRFKEQPNIRFLEIGSFEGQSTNYFVNTILTGSNSTITCVDPWIKYSESTVTKMEGWDDSINEDTYTRFMQNTAANSEKIIVKRGLSCDILPTLTDTYDFIYVDGDHSEKAVWVDAVLSFEKLRVGGILIFDDYTWNEGEKSPKNAVDTFMTAYAPYINVIAVHYQVIIEKTAHKDL